MSSYPQDEPLVPQGEVQATVTGNRLHKVNFDAVFSSPMTRTLMTAAAIVKAQEKPVRLQILTQLIEMGTRDYPVMPQEKLDRIWQGITVNTDITEKTHHVGTESETPEEMFARAKSVVDYVKENFSGDKRVLLVSHGSFGGEFLVAALMNMTYEESKKYIFMLDNASVSKFTYMSNGKVLLTCLNDTSFLSEARSNDPLFANEKAYTY